MTCTHDSTAVLVGTTQKMKHIRARGVLWNKTLRLDNGAFKPLNYFVKTYAVMERGVLEFYDSKQVWWLFCVLPYLRINGGAQDFKDIRDTLDNKAVYLKNYEISTDPRCAPFPHCHSPSPARSP
jgi:hypothetical protein